eukprot:TRINITY_DN60858_c0_g1_i1.p1 TRINITY_DN60858_c0_g1~~TRINITY_DN60858_c0_g1_i1.p1  ORF type:complete len:184 (+),score=80.06 TRINITY_DN60858_c0_g1_i1:87-638(+)
MFDFVKKLFGKSADETAKECVAAGDQGEALVDESQEGLGEIDAAIAKAEVEIHTLESREEKLREESESLLMEAHDPLLEGSIPPEAQEILTREIHAILDDVSHKREDFELRVLRLQLKRAQLLGESRRSEELLRELGRVDPLSSVDVHGVPAYPNIVKDPEKMPLQKHDSSDPQDSGVTDDKL